VDGERIMDLADEIVVELTTMICRCVDIIRFASSKLDKKICRKGAGRHQKITRDCKEQDGRD